MYLENTQYPLPLKDFCNLLLILKNKTIIKPVVKPVEKSYNIAVCLHF